MGNCISTKQNNNNEGAIVDSINHLSNIPDAVLTPSLSPFLDLQNLSNLFRTERRLHCLFEPYVSSKKLLHLVMNYEIKDDTKIKTSQMSGVHPIWMEVNKLLSQNPTLALKKDHIVDRSGRNFYCSPLEAAHWSGNWMLRDLIFQHAKRIPSKSGVAPGETRAAEQIIQWDAKAYNYDLLLLRAETDAFPRLQKTPALIKQFNSEGEDHIFQWGEVNGKWKLTELDSHTKKCFLMLPFPDHLGHAKNWQSNKITPQMYNLLKPGHTISQFNLMEFIEETRAFVQKYPTGIIMDPARHDECNAHWADIGKVQRKMPAWLAAIWCSNSSFRSNPNFKRLISLPIKITFQLHSGGNFFEVDHLNPGAIIKGAVEGIKEVMGRSIHWITGVGSGGMLRYDGIAMENLSEVILDETTKFKQAFSKVEISQASKII